ncbi:MAG: hypothetical protein Q7U91_16750 [Sideroxyarcus sp.]|nr:hypothetical protein [Sideroxyarcus sp.]
MKTENKPPKLLSLAAAGMFVAATASANFDLSAGASPVSGAAVNQPDHSDTGTRRAESMRMQLAKSGGSGDHSQHHQSHNGGHDDHSAHHSVHSEPEQRSEQEDHSRHQDHSEHQQHSEPQDLSEHQAHGAHE